MQPRLTLYIYKHLATHIDTHPSDMTGGPGPRSAPATDLHAARAVGKAERADRKGRAMEPCLSASLAMRSL